MPHMGVSCLSTVDGAIIQNSATDSPSPVLPDRPRRTPVDRSLLKSQLQKDGIEYLLVQFMDMHGAPKVKMVPHDAVDNVADSGAGFAGGAVWGMGQDAHSHDMMARIDPASYTP